MQDAYPFIETPFNFRHCCWFCREPAARVFSFPQVNNIVFNCIHPPLNLACCQECLIPANHSKATSIWLVVNDVKTFLLKRYQKDLAIGINWTKAELADSQFEEGSFAGFQRSAWFMYEVAKKRINFSGWPLIVNGVNIDELKYQVKECFHFDDVDYPDIDNAIAHYAKTLSLPESFFKEVLAYFGNEKFADTVRFCRLLVGATPEERKAALRSLPH
ncbi:hypothetical protein AADZ91_15575 [Colwelliaceae bacterium 6441]